MANTIDKIRSLLNLPELTKFYAEAKLDDGRLVVTEADSMAIGVEVRVMGDDGTAEELADGTYTLEDGTTLIVAESRITQLGDEAPAEEVEAEDKPKEEELGDKKKDELKKKLLEAEVDEAVVDVVAEIVDKMYGDDKDEMEDEDEQVEAVKEEELKAFAEEVTSVVEHLMSRIEALENQPASEGLNHSPAKEIMSAKPVDLSNMKPRERAFAFINQFQK